jgi:hypothetical protein
MVDRNTKIASLATSEGCRLSRSLLFSASLLLFLGLAGGSATTAAQVQNGPVASVGPGQSFAIADFDGDLRPDLASIQTGRGDLSSADYSIQLRLTAAGRQSVQVIAPRGGLAISARDVNGDHAVDLILTTAWLGEPVAVFLNDGHGSFSRVEPAVFPEAFNGSKPGWTSTMNFSTGAAGGPPQSGLGIFRQESNLLHGRVPAVLILASNAGFARVSFLISHAGRAPPSEVSHL